MVDHDHEIAKVTNMITIKYKGRLGNNLFQYAYARICAEQLGIALGPHPIPGFAGTSDPIAGRTNRGEPYAPLTLELPDAIPTDRPLVADGYYQHWGLMLRWRDRIREWLSLPAWPVQQHRDDILVSVRLGDYLGPASGFSRAIPTFSSFYEPLFERLRGRRVFIISDQPNHPYITTQFYGNQILNISPIDSLRLMAGFRRLVICQSTFAWWGTFLSQRAEEVYLPAPEGSLWKEGHRHIISPCDIPGWSWMPCRSIIDDGENWHNI